MAIVSSSAPSLLVIEENFTATNMRNFAAWLQGNAQVTISGTPA
jgi:hypothetical protein